MRTFEFSDAKSHKFWNIEVQGDSLTTTYGRIGTAGQTSTKTYASPEKARAEADKLIREKTGKGYAETTAGGSSSGGTLKQRDALLAHLKQHPDDPAGYAAYGDLLVEEGDIRGEFVQVQVALENPTLPAAERKRLADREAELLLEHERAWLGNLAEYLLDQRDAAEEYHRSIGRIFRHRWRRGFLESIQVPVLTLRTARWIARSPETALLRELIVQEDYFEDGYTHEDGDEPQPGIDDLPEGVEEEEAALLPLFSAPFLKTLRVLQLGEQVEEDYTDYCPFNCHLNGERAEGLVERAPNLEELRILAHRSGGKLFSLKTLTKLKVLQLYHSYDYPVERLAANPALTNLESLLFHPHAADNGVPLTAGGLRAIGRSPHLGSLRHLRYRLTDAGDEGCRAIVETGLLGRLRSLDLRHGRVTDAGLDTLMASPDFGKLQWLDLSRNRLSEAAEGRLRASGVAHLATYQTPGAAADDTEYLYAGDIE